MAHAKPRPYSRVTPDDTGDTGAFPRPRPLLAPQTHVCIVAQHRVAERWATETHVSSTDNGFLNDKEIFPEKLTIAPSPHISFSFKKGKARQPKRFLQVADRVRAASRPGCPGHRDPRPTPPPFPSLTSLALGHSSLGK